METEKPYSVADEGVATEVTENKYHTLEEVNQWSSSDDSDADYDYPSAAASSLYPTSIIAAAIAANRAANRAANKAMSSAVAVEGSGAGEGQDDIDGTLKANQQPQIRSSGVGSSSSLSESSEGETVGEPALIRQTSRSRLGLKRHTNDDKLYVVGNLDCSALRSADSRNDSEFAEEGIYQGLVMTNREKEELGILPQAIYMTTKLMEKGALIESLSLSTAASAVLVPEMPLPPESPTLFTDNRASAKNTIPNMCPPAPRRKSETTTTSASRRPRSYASASSLSEVRERHILPRYRELILRPPPLPPLESRATRAEKRVFGVVDNLLKSEAAYLTSLNIAIQVYMVPLHELASSPNPILTLEEVEGLFGPIEQILKFQEIFYSAITARTLDWKPEQKIGDVLSSLSNKAVINNYSMYINNFTNAMTTLGNAINKKPRFIQFYKEKYKSSRTSLSLQGLLLKPIQRFPQYIMFLQDLIKFTHSSHPDRVTLQLALARYEGITNFLNEHKKQREQMVVVKNLNHKVSHLPFKLTDGKRWLHRQDIVTRVMMSNGRLLSKDRCLLLFSNMVLCAAMRRRKKKGSERSRKEELESTTGSRDFESMTEFLYTCKWYCPLDKLDVIEPDYLGDIWDKHQSIKKDESYLKLKEDYKKLEQDFLQVSHIATMAATLHEPYQGLSVPDLATHVRILQRKIATVKGEIKVMQHGRMDIELPTREGDKKVCHTYIFRSEKIKQTWVNLLRYSKHKLKHPVARSWVIAEDISDCDIFEVSYKLPLFVESYNLNLINNEVMSVQCGTKVGKSCAWLASGDNTASQISIIECVTPTPLILECFKVNSKRILDIIYVPPSSYLLDTDGSRDTFQTPQQQQQHKRRMSKGSGSLTHLPPYLVTVWLGSQCGKVSIYSADSSGDDSKQCLARITLQDSVTSLQYYQDQVFAMTADGVVVIFKRLMSGFNLTNYKTVKVLEGNDRAIRCTCKVGNKLWLGVGGSCHIFNMQKHEAEGVVHMTSEDRVVVNNMVYQGEGVWVSYKGSSSLELFHTSSKQPLQNIDVQTALQTIIKRRKLESRITLPSRVYVTSVLASHGYLWIGTNAGCLLVYHIPYLDTVPIVSGKPYLAMDSHQGSVRVLLPIHTSGTVESSRVKQFEDDESHRLTLLHEGEDSNTMAFDATFRLPEGNDCTMVRRRSNSLPPETRQREELITAENGVDESAYASPGGVFVSDTTETGIKRSSTVSAADVRSGRAFRKVSSNKLQSAKQEVVRDVSADGQGEKEQAEDKGREEEQAEREEDGEAVNGKVSSSSSSMGSDRSDKEKGDGENDSGRVVAETEEKKDGEDDDYNSDELESKERFKDGIRPLSSAQNNGAPNGDILGARSPKLQSFAVLAQDSLRDSGDYTIPRDLEAIRNSAISSRYEIAGADETRKELTEEDPYSDPRELDTVGMIRRRNGVGLGDGDDDPYDNPSELGMIGTEANGKGEDGPYDEPAELGMPVSGAEANGRGGDGPYDDPTELGMMKKLSTLELIGRSRKAAEKIAGTSPYDFPGELADDDGSVHPYEDPATLTKDVSTPSALFSTKALNNSLYIPQRNSNVTEGAVFVLTAGRGLRNLRPGKKASIFNQANRESEACMMAYEIELS